jgi:hypothetical protein
MGRLAVFLLFVAAGEMIFMQKASHHTSTPTEPSSVATLSSTSAPVESQRSDVRVVPSQGPKNILSTENSLLTMANSSALFELKIPDMAKTLGCSLARDVGCRGLSLNLLLEGLPREDLDLQWENHWKEVSKNPVDYLNFLKSIHDQAMVNLPPLQKIEFEKQLYMTQKLIGQLNIQPGNLEMVSQFAHLQNDVVATFSANAEFQSFELNRTPANLSNPAIAAFTRASGN